MRKTLLMAMLAVVCSCKEESAKIIASKQEPISQKPEDGPGIDEFVKQFRHRRQQIIKQLKTFSPKQADSLYEIYVLENKKLLADETQKEIPFLKKHYYSFMSTGVDSISREKMEILDAVDLEIISCYMDQLVIKEKYSFYKNIFDNYVTNDYKAYIDLKAENVSKIESFWIYDDKIRAPWKEIGANVIAWENLIKKYPDSKLIKEMETEYKWFTGIFIAGTEKTPVKSINNTLLKEEAKLAFEDFLIKYPNSKAATIVKKALNNKQDGKGYSTSMKILFEKL